MEIERLKPKMDATSFIILQLLSEGFSKKDIIDQLNIDKNVFGKHIRRLGNNNRLKRIITLR
jgi:DNA-binding CsgD family transcriptional regulator